MNEKRVDKEGYPALWRALAALLVIELEPELREGSKAPSYRRGANLRLVMRHLRFILVRACAQARVHVSSNLGGM